MLANTLVLSCVFLLVTSHRQRESRFFSFNFEDRDITVDLDFSIPFISIPIKKTSDAFGLSELPTVNINPASLALGSAVVLGTTILLPLIMKHYASNAMPDYRFSRMLDNSEFGADSVLNFASKMLTEGNGLRGCTLRVACWTAQTHDENLTRVLSRITRNRLLSTIVNSTAVEDAMYSGMSGRDCSKYTPCPIREQYMPIMLHNLSVLSKSYGI